MSFQVLPSITRLRGGMCNCESSITTFSGVSSKRPQLHWSAPMVTPVRRAAPDDVASNKLIAPH